MKYILVLILGIILGVSGILFFNTTTATDDIIDSGTRTDYIFPQANIEGYIEGQSRNDTIDWSSVKVLGQDCDTLISLDNHTKSLKYIMIGRRRSYVLYQFNDTIYKYDLANTDTLFKQNN